MRIRPWVLLGVAAAALAGCTGTSAAPQFRPSPNGPVEGTGGVQIQPAVPVPSLASPGAGTAGGGTGTPGTGTSSAPRRVDPLVVATRLSAPVGLALLPDGSALVGERTTGRIVRVQPEPGEPVPTVRTLTGLDHTGDGGLLDLAVSPDYAEDDLVYAYVTTRTDNRVVDFTLDGPVTPVLTGIPKGRTDNSGRLAFGVDGDLYVGTGDAGRPALARRASSLAGKVLRIDAIGSPAAGNPQPSSPVFTRGQHAVDGLCVVPRSSVLIEDEPAAGGQPDEINQLVRGADYGWPGGGAGSQAPAGSVPAADSPAGGCAVLGNRVWFASLGGRALVSAPLAGTSSAVRLGTFTSVLTSRYGRLRTVVAAPDGALWLTTSNRDGHGRPVAADERVIRYVPASGSTGGIT